MPKVIKGDAAPGQLAPAGPALVDRKVINRDVFSAQQSADETHRAGEQRAAERRARGEQEAQAAYQAALSAGRLAGLAEISALAIDGYFQRAHQLRQAVDDCLLISRHICTKILGRPTKVAEGEERRIANEALLQAIKKQRLVIGVSVHDYGALERGEAKLLAALAEAPEFNLECIAATPDGSATLRTPDSEFVAPLAAALDRLCKVLILPKVKVQFANPEAASAAVVDGADGGEPDAEATAAEDDGGYSEFASADELAAEQVAGSADEPSAEAAAGPEPADGAEDAGSPPRQRVETAGMHDISRLVAAIDAEDDK